MKSLAIVILLVAGVLSAPRYSHDFGNYFFSKEYDCGDLERLNSRSTTIFDYVGESRNTISGSTPDDTGILLKARIYIHPLKACQFRMQLNEVELLTKSKTQSDFVSASESVKFRRELQAQELTFTVADGKITKLFPTPTESIHVLNIKRGILSALQLGKPTATEELDVNGRCAVKIVEKNGEIVKSKNMAECSERVLNEVGYQTTSFEKNDLPIQPLNSTSVCKYTVLRNKIRSVDCQETHIFRPFSAGYESPSGAITIIKQKLIFKGEKYGYISDAKASHVTESGTDGVSLIFQHEKEEIKPDKTIINRLDQVMTNLVDNSKVDNLSAKQNSAHDFTKLVELLRKLNRKTMIPVWDKYFDCEQSRVCKVGDAIKDVYRQFLLDALTYCGTETCVYAVHNVIVDGKIGRETMNNFLEGIALVAKPTKSMIRDVLNIAKKRSSRQGFLTLGTLMYRYCRRNIAGCAYDARNPITHAELFLENKLGKDCSGQENYEHVEEMLMALKAIGNAGRPVHAWKTLLTCAKNSLHQNVSVAALDALRRMPCNQKIQNALHIMHETTDIDPETRIHVYLALMKCPNEDTLKRVVGQLGKEKSRQVGSFMASHLHNLNESSDPRHQKTQQVLAVILKKETLDNFNLDLTKYSRAFEGSVHSGWLKSGASLESHLIFSPNSYMPRSALMNMTATILNVPVNILEMAARVEGIETLLEDFFGDEGYFPDNNILKMFNITFTKDDMRKLRTRRNVDDDTLDENIAELHEKINKRRVRPSGNLNIKVFGHEMRVFSYDDIFWAVDQIDNMNVIELLLKFAKGGHKTFTKSMLFLELTHTVPTGFGLPLKLKLTGSTVASLELNGKVDIRNMFWGPSSMEIKGYLRPSAVVELAGQMGIHSHYADSGIFVNSSMFTSQKLKGSVIYKHGQTLQVTLDAPEEPNQLFNFSSTPFLFLNEEANLVQGASRRITPDFCINSTMALGLGLCTRLSLPVAFREYESPYFPLSGPSSFGMNLIKSDAKLTSYQFSVNMKKMNTVNKNELVGWFEMGTPGATYSRRIAAIIKFVETRTSRMLTIGSFEGGLVNRELIKNKIEFMVSYHNDTNRFEMDLRSNLFTNKIFKMKFLYFNDTHFLGRQMGVLMSAEYDWYKFENLVKFVKKTTSYLLHSRTTYWPKQHLTSEIELVPTTKSIAIRLNANQINQSVEMLGKYTKTKFEKGIKFTATHLSTMTKTSFYVGILNEESAKKFIINGTALGRKAELSWGYYAREMVRELRFKANIAGKSMALFAAYNKLTDSWLTATIGGTVGKNKIGISTEYVREDYSFDRKLCSFIFYNTREPLKTCLALKKVPSSWTTPEYKRLIWTTTILSRSGAIAFDYKNNNGKYGLTTTATYGDRMIFTNSWELMYDSIWNNELKMTMEVGKKTVSTKWFSTMLRQNLCTFGIEATGFNKMLKLMATYSKETKGDSAIHGVILEAWMNKKLPVNFSVILELGKTFKRLSSILKIKSYKVKNSLLWIQPEANNYSGVVDFAISKGTVVIFRNKLSNILVWNSAQKAYKVMWEFMIWNKKFEYGWDLTYQNHSTLRKMAHALTFGLNYARNRRSSITTTLVNSVSKVELLVDVEYLPQRHVSHVVRFHKDAKQLDVILEFLPRMFVKLMGRLDKVDGWRLTTDVTFDWENYRRVFQSMTAYINRTDTTGLSFQFSAFGNQFYTGVEVNHKTQNGIITLSAFKHSLKLVGYWLSNRRLGGVKILTEKTGDISTQTKIIEALMEYSKMNGDIFLELRTPSRSLLQTVYSYDKSDNLVSLEFFALEQRLLKLSGQYNRYKQSIVLQTFIFGKKRFQMAGKYNQETKNVILNLDAMKKNLNIVFAAKWDADKKQVSFSTQILNRIFGFVTRLDARKYVSSFHVFYQRNLVGWTAYLDKTNKALVYNITLTPRLSAQVTLEIVKDHVIKLTAQRKIGPNIVNETTLTYELTSESSKLALQWNIETLKTVRNVITPIIEIGVTNVTTLAKNVNSLAERIHSLSKNMSKELVRDTISKVLAILNKGDEHFDKFDFVAARDKIGEIAVSILKTSAKLSSVGLERTSHLLTKTHENIPVIMEQTLKLTRKALDLTNIIYKVTKNLTESGVPVIKAAIKLAKEFRVRDRTMEQIIKQVLEMVKNVSTTWKKNMAVQLKELTKNITEYIKKIPIPYRSEKVGEIYDKIVADLSLRIENFNLEQTVKRIMKMVLEYEIKGQSLKGHVVSLNRKAVELPDIIKRTAVRLIGKMRVSMKTTHTSLTKYIRRVQHLSLPLVNLLKKINASIYKHFSPLLRKAVNKLEIFSEFSTSEFSKIYRPLNLKTIKLVQLIEKIFTPLLRPIRPLYEDLKNQVRAIHLLEQEIGSVFDKYIEEFKTRGEIKLQELKNSFNKIIKIAKEVVKSSIEMTPEEIAEATVDNTIIFGKKSIVYLKNLYESRMQIIKQVKVSLNKAVEIMKDVSGVITSKTVEDLVHIVFIKTGESVVKTLKEAVLLIDQISMINVIKPLESFWKELNLINHLRKFGINDKIINVISTAKTLNLTEALFETVERLNKLFVTAYNTTEQQMMKMSGNTLDVYRYIRAIPKKDFEQFFTEVESFLKSKLEMKDVLINMYSVNLQRLQQITKILETMYTEYYNTYSGPLKNWYFDTKQAAIMVYEENKDDTMVVYTYYKTIIVGLVKEKYQKLLTNIEKKYDEVNKMILALYNKCADKTLEEILTNIVNFGQNKSEIVLMYTKVKLEKAQILANNLIRLSEEFYKNMTILAKNTIAYVNSTIDIVVLPRLIKIYEKSASLIKTNTKLCCNKLSELFLYYKDLVDSWYDNNNDKSLRMLYLDAKDILIDQYKVNMENAKEMAGKRYSEVLTKLTEMKEQLVLIKNKVFPILKEEAESMINQTLRAAVILANETAKSYYPHYTIIKGYAKSYYNKGKESTFEIYTMSSKKVVALYKKALVQIRLQANKLMKLSKELPQRVKNHPAYEKVINHKLVGKGAQWLNDAAFKLEKQINEARDKLEVLRYHPKVISLKEKLEDKTNEYRELLNEYKEHPNVEKLISVLKQINESGLHTILKLKERLDPHVSLLQKSFVEIPEMVMSKVNFFHQYPEECFWTTVKNLKTILETLKSYEWTILHEKLWTEAKDLVDQITDEKTKEAATNFLDVSKSYFKEILEFSDNYSKKMRMLPSWFKNQCKTFYQQTWKLLNEQWKTNPLYPIANHEIWRELAGEFLNHEIVSELKSLGLQGKDASIEYTYKLIDYANLKKTELKEGISQFTKNLETNFNTFVDETTLEDVATKIKELNTFIKSKKVMIVRNLAKTYKVASAKLLTHYNKVKAIGDKYIENITILWNKHYPKLVEKATLKWEQTMRKAESLKKEYSTLAMEMKENYTKMALQLWNSDEVKQNLETLKKLTIRKAVDQIMKLPEKTKTVTKKLYKKAVAEVKSNFDRYLLPYVNIAKNNVVIIFNEINETAVFVYRYYRLKDNYYGVKDYMGTIKNMTETELKRIDSYLRSELKRIAPKVPVAVKEYLKIAGTSGLKAIHSSMVYADNVDIKPYVIKMKAYMKPYVIKMKSYIPDFKKYVMLDTNKGKIVLSLPHYRSITPSFTYHINKVANQIQTFRQTLRTFSADVLNKTIATTKLMLEKMKAKTRELRKDLNESMLVHKMVGLHLFNKAKFMGNLAYNITLDMSKTVYLITMEFSDLVSKRVQKETKSVYAKAEAVVVDIYQTNSIQEAFEKIKDHYNIVINNFKVLLLKYYKVTDNFAKDWYKDMKLTYDGLLNNVKPYYIAVKNAIADWRSGTDLRTAFKLIELQLRKTYRIMTADFQSYLDGLKKSGMSSISKDTWKLAGEYIKIHKDILGKYGKRIFKLYRYTKARLDRAIRIAKTIAGKYWRKPIEVMNPYRSVAMIFGKSHIMTFDNKYHNLPTYPKPHCTYVLARDFQRGNFTVLSQKEHLIVLTPDMRVKINMNGKVVSVIDKQTVEDLPVQSSTGFCKRMDDVITCEFKQGLRVQCDIGHSLCTIELSGWDYSKSQGLLGTNNYEVYDEMKLPDGKITQSMTKFMNAWEVSGDRRCLISESTNEVQSCNKPPSEQCFKLLKEKTSAYGVLFGVVDPVSFFKACQVDSADCESKEPYETSHCNAVAAYVHMLRLKGIWVPLPKDCVTYTTEAKKTYNVGESWVQPSTKSVDVVVMISERMEAQSIGKQLASLIFNLNKKLHGYSTRFALVGFGGNGVFEDPHHHTLNGDFFSDVFSVATVIRKMPYTGRDTNLNDAYGAILLASRLKFRPGAARVFLLLNSDEYKPNAWYGPTLDETIMAVKYESNATLVAFDQLNLMSMGTVKFIGQNEKRDYLFPSKSVSSSRLQLPNNPFTKLVKITHGGMFTNNLKPSQSKITEMALTDVFMQIIENNSHSCKSCRVRGHMYRGQAVPICRNNNMVRC